MKKEPGFFKNLRHRTEYALFLFLALLIRPLTPAGIHRIGKAMGNLAYFLASKRKRIALTNLDIAFGDSKTRHEKQRIIKKSFSQMAVSALQCLWITHDTRNRVHRLIEKEPKGLDSLRECMKKNNGVFSLNAHYGNWEIMGIYHGYLGIIPLNSIVRRLDNPYLEKAALEFRTISGNGIFYRDDPPLKIVHALKKEGGVAVMMDQNTAVGGIFVDFFGKKAATPRSLALLSYKTGAPILPVFAHPTEKGTYELTYGPPLNPEKTGDQETDIANWTRECLKVLEKVIRERPEAWMWGHRRWKTRPPEEKGIKIY